MSDEAGYDRKLVELAIDAWLATEADAAGLDLPAELERALKERLANLHAGHRTGEMREAIECINAYIEEQGLPIEKLHLP